MEDKHKALRQPITIKRVSPQIVYELFDEKSEIIDYIDCAEGSLIDSYLIFNDDFQGTKLWEAIEENVHAYNGYLSMINRKLYNKSGEREEIENNQKIDLTTLKEYGMIYILEAYKNCSSSDYTVILADDYIQDHEDIFYQDIEEDI